MLGVWHRTRLKGLGFLIDIALDELECLLMRWCRCSLRCRWSHDPTHLSDL